MLKNIFLSAVLLASLLIPSIVFSEEQKYKDYTVKVGDTLWDISANELKDPFLWPKIWKENPDIKNPDWLLPGQIVRIPLYLIQPEKKEEVAAPPKVKPVIPKEPVKPKSIVKEEKKPEPVKLRPVVDKNVLIASGFIADPVMSIGTVAGSPSGRNLMGTGDPMYIKTKEPVKIGDKFYIVRADKMVTHPVSGKKVGYIVEIRGIADIVKIEYGDTIASVAQMYGEIMSGDLVVRYYEINPPLVIPPYRKPNVEGIVLAARDLKVLNNNYDIVYLDRGFKNGLAAGDLIKTVATGAHLVPNGTIQVIDCRENTATAVVLKNTGPIMPGNLLNKLE